VGLTEVVSFTALINLASRAVLERIGMRNPGRDFDYPRVPVGSPLRRHCLYTVMREEWTQG
jgi:RimJ/RimL family protein N-acetyltransferase